MKRVRSWYKLYGESVERCFDWLSSNAKRQITCVVLLLISLGVTWGWQPYCAIAHGASLTDWTTTYGRSGPQATQIWVAALFPTMSLLIGIAIPLFILFPSVELPSWVRPRGRNSRARPKRKPARRYPSDNRLRLLDRIDPESACFALMFLLMVGFPMWRVGEALVGGVSLFYSVNLSRWCPAALMPLWAGAAYVGIMSWLGQRTYRSIKQHPNKR